MTTTTQTWKVTSRNRPTTAKTNKQEKQTNKKTKEKENKIIQVLTHGIKSVHIGSYWHDLNQVWIVIQHILKTFH